MSNNLNTKKILITGGSGFIGTHLVNYLMDQTNYDILNISLNKPYIKEHNYYWKKCDLLDRESLFKIIKDYNPTYVIHLAAKTGLSKNIDNFIVNIQGTKNLIDILRELNNLERAIFTSSSLVCRLGYVPKHELDFCPPSMYGLSKVKMEELIRKELKNSKFIWTIVRPVYIWGPLSNQPLTLLLFKAISRGWYFHIHSERYYSSLKTFGYVKNTVYQYYKILHAAKEKVHQKTIYLGDPPITLFEFAEIIRDEIKGKKIKKIPLIFARLASKLGDVLNMFGIKSPLYTERLNNMLLEYKYPVEYIIQISSPLPYDIRKAVRETINLIFSLEKTASCVKT